jgi:CheY-like chemotaxis protein
MLDYVASHVLIVDDDPDIRESLSELLQNEGFVASSAANGQEALDYLAREPAPALILLDLMMPVMDGVEFRNAQLANPELGRIPIVVISASGRSQRAAQELGALAYLEKPIDLKLMFRIVRTACGGSGG